MMKFTDSPNLKVIDRAIWLIQHDFQNYTCCALYSATYSIEKGSLKRMEFWKTQYTTYVHQNKSKNWSPFWWDYSDRGPRIDHARTARIKALQGFKQACIDAAKRKK